MNETIWFFHLKSSSKHSKNHVVVIDMYSFLRGGNFKGVFRAYWDQVNAVITAFKENIIFHKIS